MSFAELPSVDASDVVAREELRRLCAPDRAYAGFLFRCSPKPTLDIRQSKIYQLQYVPANHDPEVPLPARIDLLHSETVGIDLDSLRIDSTDDGSPGLLWGTGRVAGSPGQPHSWVWNHQALNVYPYPGFPPTLAIDERDGSVWTHGGDPANPYAVVHLVGSAHPLEQRFSGFDNHTYDFSVEPDSGALWVSHEKRWVKYATDLGRLEERVSIAVTPVKNISVATYQGQVSLLDNSLWGAELVGSLHVLLRHWDSDGVSFLRADEKPQDLGEDRNTRIVTWAGVPDLTDRGIGFDSSAAVRAAAEAPSEVPLEELSPTVARLSAEAEAEGLSLGAWLQQDPVRRLDLTAAASEIEGADEALDAISARPAPH
jgi:hypothetical protein